MNTQKLLSVPGFIILLILFSTSCKREPKNEEVVRNYGTGQISKRYNLIDGKKEGLMVDYYPDGSLKAERLFRNDTQVDKTTLYYNTGEIKEVQYYKDGKVQGGDTVFYEDGKPQFLIDYDKGFKHGYVRKWGPDGTLTYEAKYNHDTLIEVKGQTLLPDTLKKN
ncbi:MAG TPA: hypothetical protein VMZ69_04820 [Saprospiraceae bacterium]|nr:hypothetical protein [Saprospiraceae bacterium]